MRANELESSELHQQPLHVSLKFAECRLPVPVIEPYAFVASFFRQFLRTISESTQHSTICFEKSDLSSEHSLTLRLHVVQERTGRLGPSSNGQP
jgi:hypothetical protein